MRRKSSPSSSSRSRRERLGAIPWAVLLQSGLVVGRRVSSLSAKDRAQLARLLRESHGWPASLGERDREELRKIVAKLNMKKMGREMLPVIRRARRGRTLRGTGTLKGTGKRR